jgi:threonine synthase
MTIWQWAEHIDYVPPEHRLSLGEGGSPLLRSRKIGPDAGLSNLYFKLDTTNPTGSFKDRFAAAAVSHMLAQGKRHCVATSSGNTGSSLAAYCSAAGIRCSIAIVETAPAGKLTQMMCYGANIFRVRGFGLEPDITTQALNVLQELGSAPGCALQVSSYVYSPSGMSGVESVSFELQQQLADTEHVFAPAGGGGLCIGLARGYQSLVGLGQRTAPAAVHCVQPEGNDTIAGPLRDGKERAEDVQCTTKVSGLQVASVVDGHLAVPECRATGGTGHVVTDDETWAAQKQLAREEGIFSEPAGAVALAGALNAVRSGVVPADAKIVCMVTGMGFKDGHSLDRMLGNQESPVIDVDEMAKQVN